MHLPFWLRGVLLAVLLRTPLLAHPVPDVPVRAFFDAGGGCLLQVEVDPRCFADDPAEAPSLLYPALRSKPEAERKALLEQARTFVTRTVEHYFEPLGRILPEFQFDFTGKNAVPLAHDEDVVVLTGSWQSSVPAGIHGYRIRAAREAKLSVLFLNHLQGEAVERTQVLFPGETSFLLDVTGLTGTSPASPAPGSVGVKAGAGGWWRTFGSFFRQGFVHVLPLGFDHILFVLGLFLLRREWRPLLWQVTTFTAAHTLTLALATLGWVSVPAHIVEPIIAASLFFVAMENIFRPRYTMWRLLVVFVFGLVHGLGFAGALQEYALPPGALTVGLLGFNAGVEGGQIAVVALAFLATTWLRNPVLYRQFVVVPGSAAIAVMGLWMTFQRVLGPPAP